MEPQDWRAPRVGSAAHAATVEIRIAVCREILSSVVETILVVEDDADSRRFFRTALTVAGYRVIEAGDGLDALRLLDSQRPAAVVLDLHLPLVSGRVVLQEIA